MTDTHDSDHDDPTAGADDPDVLAAHAERNKEAWTQTLDDMEALAAEREREGWKPIVVPAGDTAPEPPDSGPPDRYGLVHVVPGNKADALRVAFDAGEFPQYDVYRGETESRVFLVTELLDPETETAIYVAGNFRRRDARALVRTVRETGEMYTHFQKLDETRIGSVRHDGYRKFFPNADRVAEDPGPAG
jgi:hypothetical protein